MKLKSACKRRVSVLERLCTVCIFACAAPSLGQVWTLGDVLDGPLQCDAQFGWALGGSGDLNADGLGDVAAGARFFNVDANTAAGAVFVFRGGGPPGSPALLRIDGLSAHEHFGESLAGGRDINGDGHPDLVVGAPLRTVAGLSACGAVDVFLGGAAFSGQRWATLAGAACDDWFGQSVALGDVNGDGFADVIVGAPYSDLGGSAAGSAYVFLGGPTPPTGSFVVLIGQNPNDQFGWSVAYAGDMNGDGFGDIAVGARLFGFGPAQARGKVYLFRGGAAMDAVPDGTWLGAAANDWFGNSVAAPGDVDGGGRADLLVGAPYNDAAASNAGAAYLFRGEDTPGSPAAVVYHGESADAQFGWNVAGAGDVNGDGQPDMVVGARLQSVGGLSAAGRAYLFLGGAPLSSSSAAIANGAAANDWFGQAVGAASGYFQTDHGAAIVGAPYNDAVASAAGRAYVYAAPPICPVGDVDADCDVDLADLAALVGCLGGPGTTPSASCATGIHADVDGDIDVDLRDFGWLQTSFTGPH